MNKYARIFAVLFVLTLLFVPALLTIFWAQLLLLFKSSKSIHSGGGKDSGRTVMLSGGKMTKCLQLARMFKSQGDRLIVVETPLYKYCGTRFSNAVDKFMTIPDIEGDGSAFCDALVAIATREKVDLFVPVSSPKSAWYEAKAKPNFPEYTEVFQFDQRVIEELDDKHRFVKLARKFGLSAPSSFHIDDKQSLLQHQFEPCKKYILKKIDYDPVYRLDLRTLPHEGWKERVNALPISREHPWVLQEFVEGREICTHTTTCQGGMNLYICSDSSPFQVNYKMLDLPEVKNWVRAFVKQLNATGQISFDFIVRDDGEVMPIECNPRTHSAITLFHNQLSAAAAYYSPGNNTERRVPNAGAGHTYWLYHELYRLVTSKNRKQFHFLWRRIKTGKEAIFQWNDPWPFLFNYHISIPYQILKKMLSGVFFTRIDFNIGKIIVPGGD